MVIVFPLGLWVFSFVCDLIFRFGGQRQEFDTVALYTMIGGVVGALAAAIPGFVDWLSLTKGTRAKRIGTFHMWLNLLAVGLYAVNTFWRLDQPVRTAGPLLLSGLTMVVLTVSGWLGGSLVYEEHVGVIENKPAR
jgi:uncharacterized membrane protein